MGRPAAVSLSDWTEQAVNVIERLARTNDTVTAEVDPTDEEIREQIEKWQHVLDWLADK